MGFVMLLMASLSQDASRWSRVITPDNIHDYGKLLLAFTMIWAYFSFSQFLIIWSANLPEEIPWYLDRMQPRLGVGQHPAARRPVLPAVLPAAVARPEAHAPAASPWSAVFVLVMRYVDFYWNVMPALHHETPMPHWTRPGDGGRARRLCGWRCSRGSTRARRCCRSATRIFAEALSSHGADTECSRARRTSTRAARCTATASAPRRPALNHEVTDIPLDRDDACGGDRPSSSSAVVMLLMWGAWGFFLAQARRRDPGKPPMAAEDYGQRLPATPRLQSMPTNDLARLPRRAGRQARSAMAWVDQSAGTVRIPIERGDRADRRPRRRLRRSAGQGARGSLVGVPGARHDRRRRAAAPAAAPAPAPASRRHGADAAAARRPRRTRLRSTRSMRTAALTIAALLTSATLAAAQGSHAPRPQPAVERGAERS